MHILSSIEAQNIGPHAKMQLYVNEHIFDLTRHCYLSLSWELQWG